MDFTLTEDQLAVQGLAEQILQGRATVERVKAVEAGEDRFDRELWADLAKSELIGLCLPEEDGGEFEPTKYFAVGRPRTGVRLLPQDWLLEWA